jgi:formylglycine-generating enzyme required for sulfatase activity
VSRVALSAGVITLLLFGVVVVFQSCGTSGSSDAGTDVQSSDGPSSEAMPSDAACVTPIVEKKCSDGWCQVPPGCYRMGSPTDEWGRGENTEDIIEVTLTHSFIIQQHEVVQAEWIALGMSNRAGWFDGGPGNSFGDCVAPNCPASTMTWYEAADYSNRLSTADGRAPCYKLTGCGLSDAGTVTCSGIGITAGTVYDCTGYRLPTEAEWEYAARAGTTTAFYSGAITPFGVQGDCNYDKNLDPIGWYCWNSDASTHPVGLKQPNAWGLYDMAGNAYEMANDPFHGRYTRTASDPWQLMPSPNDPVVRGGIAHAWASLARSADRMYGPTDDQVAHAYGFRLVRTLAPNEQWHAPTIADAGPD